MAAVELVIVLVAVGAGAVSNVINRPVDVRSDGPFIPVIDRPAYDQHARLDATVYFPPSTPAPAC